MNKCSDTDWVYRKCLLVSIVLVFSAVAAFFSKSIEFGFILTALSVVSLFFGWIMRRQFFGGGLLILMFLSGYVISWGVGFLGYRYLLIDFAIPLDLPTKHTITTAQLVLLSIVSTAAGAGLIFSLYCPKSPAREMADHRVYVVRSLFIFAGIYIVFQIASLQVMGLNARSEIGNYHEVGSASYIVAGFNMVAYPFYALLGFSLKPKLICTWNFLVALVIILVIGLLSLTGGRSTALEPLVVLFVGAAFSGISWRKIMYLGAGSLPLIAFVMIVVGVARGTGDFIGGNVTEKVHAITSVVKERRSMGDQYDSPLYVLFSRLYEPSAQAVIDNVADTGRHVGFLNYDRLLFIFIPKFVYAGKKPLDDSNERLRDDYGYATNEYTSAPLTLLADSFERFGYWGVAVVHFIAGLLLSVIGVFIIRMRERVLALILMVCCARSILLVYTVSTLGFLHILLYGLFRDIVIISLIYYMGKFMLKSLRGKFLLMMRPRIA